MSIRAGRFAISNLGMMGIENFDAVINPPHGVDPGRGCGDQEAGGAGGRDDWRGDGDVDDAVGGSPGDRRGLGAEFLKAVIEALENPMVMLA